MPKLEPYDKRADYSYCLGLYPCHALLDSRPGAVQRLLLHPDGLGRAWKSCAGAARSWGFARKWPSAC